MCPIPIASGQVVPMCFKEKIQLIFHSFLYIQIGLIRFYIRLIRVNMFYSFRLNFFKEILNNLVPIDV
jgi:hypothetical protein